MRGLRNLKMPIHLDSPESVLFTESVYNYNRGSARFCVRVTVVVSRGTDFRSIPYTFCFTVFSLFQTLAL